MKFVRLLLLVLVVFALPAQETNPGGTANFNDNLPPAPPPPPSPSALQFSRDRVVFGAFTLPAGDTVGDLTVIGGNANILGTVERNLVVVGGKATIRGVVERDAIVVLGAVEMTGGARIGNDAILIGGPFDVPDTATIEGERTIIPIGDVVPQIEWFKAWLKECLLLGRLLSFDLVWPWVVLGFFFMLYSMLLLVFPSSVRGTVTAIEERPVASLFAGLLTMVFFAPFLVVLAVSLVGILIIPFLILALFIIAFFGKTGVLCCLGRAISRNSGLRFLENPVLAFLTGAIVLSLAYTVPVCGIIAFAAASVFGLGGAMMALVGNFKREESSIPPVPVLAGTMRAPDGSGAAVASGVPSFTAAAHLDPVDTVLLRRAGFWKRTAAAVLDLVLLSLLIPFSGPLVILVGIAYFVAMWTWKGTTIGSIVLGLKLVRIDGRPMNFAVALVRSLSSIFSAVVFMLGFFWAGWDPEKQSWHDKIAGTIVVEMPRDFALI